MTIRKRFAQPKSILNLFIILILVQTKITLADTVFTLPNGLQVHLNERHEKPLVALDLWIRAGSREEKAGEEGSAHFLEHTLFKGTTTRKTGELDFAIESLGGIFSAATGPDYAHFGTVIAPSAVEPALLLLSDLVRNAALPREEIDRERTPILDELAIHGADETVQAIEAAYALAYEKHSYRRSPGGTSEEIQARTRENLLAFYRRNYLPERTILVIAGDFDSTAIRESLTKTFGDWKQADTKPDAKVPPILEPELKEARLTERDSATSEGRIVIGFRVPAAADSTATRTLLLLDALLGSSDSGGMLQIPALTGTNATARYTPRLDGSLFLLTAEVPPTADPARIESALEEVVQRLQTVPPKPSTLQSACQQVLSQARYEGETLAGWARQIGYAALVQADNPADLPRVLPLIKPSDVLKTAQTYFDWNRRITVRLLPPSRNRNEGKPLDKN